MQLQTYSFASSRRLKSGRSRTFLFAVVLTTFALACLAAPRLAFADDVEPTAVVEETIEATSGTSVESGDSDKQMPAATAPEQSVTAADEAGSSGASVTSTDDANGPDDTQVVSNDSADQQTDQGTPAEGSSDSTDGKDAASDTSDAKTDAASDALNDDQNAASDTGNSAAQSNALCDCSSGRIRRGGRIGLFFGRGR